MYQVKNWEQFFEGAKSKTYDNKSSCSMPCKHGLGYKKLVKRKNGAALFGAWVALIQILSRHPKKREGYCTDTGKPDGTPYSTEDLETLTEIPKSVFDEMLKTTQSIGWVDFIPIAELEGYNKDTEGIQQGTKVPLNSDSDSDSDLNKDSKRGTLISFGEFHRVKLSQVEYDKVVERFGSDSQRAIEMLDGYIEQGNKAKYRNHYAVFRKDNWIWNKIKFGGITGKPKGTRSEDFI